METDREMQIADPKQLAVLVEDCSSSGEDNRSAGVGKGGSGQELSNQEPIVGGKEVI